MYPPHHAPHTPYHLPPPPPPRRPRFVWAILAALVILCGAAVTTLVILVSEDESTPDTQASEVPETPAQRLHPKIPEVHTPAPTPQRNATTVTLLVRSQPAGAEVYRNNELLGVTPLRVELPRGSASESWTLLKDGHELTALEVNLAFSGEFSATLPVLATAPVEPEVKEPTREKKRPPATHKGRTRIDAGNVVIPD